MCHGLSKIAQAYYIIQIKTTEVNFWNQFSVFSLVFILQQYFFKKVKNAIIWKHDIFKLVPFNILQTIYKVGPMSQGKMSKLVLNWQKWQTLP